MIEINLPSEGEDPNSVTPILVHNGAAYMPTFMGINHLGQHIFLDDEDWESLEKELPHVRVFKPLKPHTVGDREYDYMALRMQIAGVEIYIVRERDREQVPDK
jgi:hypothetical protein